MHGHQIENNKKKDTEESKDQNLDLKRRNSKEKYGNNEIEPSTRKEVEQRARMEVENVRLRLEKARDLVEQLLKGDDTEIVATHLECHINLNQLDMGHHISNLTNKAIL